MNYKPHISDRLTDNMIQWSEVLDMADKRGYFLEEEIVRARKFNRSTLGFGAMISTLVRRHIL